MRLKILVSAVISLSLGYSLFWYYMAGELEDRIEAWVGVQKSRGLSIQYNDMEINGFPYRMEFSFNKFKAVKTNRGGVRVHFTSPHITYIAFPWKINHGVIIGDGGGLRLGSRRHPELTLNFIKSRASVMIDTASGQFQRTSLVFNDVSWTMEQNDGSEELSRAGQVKLHIMRPIFSADVDDMELPVQMKLYLEAEDVTAYETFGRKMEQVKIDLQLHGEELPIYSKDGLASWRDIGGTLAVKNLEVVSGGMAIELSGDVTLDQDLKPLGAFSVKLRAIDQFSGIFSSHPTFQKAPGNLILQELDRMSRAGKNGGKEALDLSISLQGGLLYFGSIPVYELTPVVE